MTLTQGTEKFSLLFCCLPDILLSVDLCVPVCAPSRRTVAAVAAVFILWVCCVIHIPPLPSSVNYLFRLLRVRIKRDRAPGSTARDGMTFRTDCRMAESTHALIDALSKTMWIRRRGDRAVPNQGQPHPGEIVLLLLLRKKSISYAAGRFRRVRWKISPTNRPTAAGQIQPNPSSKKGR